MMAVPILLSACMPLPGSGSRADPPSDKLVLTGSSTMAPLMAELARRFEHQHPGVRVDVQTGGSSRGVADVRRGLADIGMVSRDLTADEDDLQAFPVARDGIALIVHRDNTLESLTRDQVVGIFTGRIRNWAELGGPNAPITVVNKAEGHSTLKLFLEHFGLSAEEVRADVIIGDNEQGVKTVAGNPHAIGYVSIGTAEYDAEHGVPIRLVSLDGIAATSKNVRQGSYPLVRTLHLVTLGQPSGLSRVFIEFTRSGEVDEVVEAYRFVPLSQ